MYMSVTLAASPPQELQRKGTTETHQPIIEIEYLDGLSSSSATKGMSFFKNACPENSGLKKSPCDDEVACQSSPMQLPDSSSMFDEPHICF